MRGRRGIDGELVTGDMFCGARSCLGLCLSSFSLTPVSQEVKSSPHHTLLPLWCSARAPGTSQPQNDHFESMGSDQIFLHEIILSSLEIQGTGEMARQLRAPVDLAEDPGSVSSTHMVAPNHSKLQL